MTIAIVDDELSEAITLKAMTEEALALQRETADIRVFCDAEAFVRGYAGQTDLILLDIQMPGIDGMTCAERIRERDANVLLIFVTSMIQYAVQGYRVDAMDYIVKPVTPPLLEHALSRALRRLRRQAPHMLTVKAADGLRSLPVESILYAEAVNHRVVLHTETEAIPCAQTLLSLEETLLQNGFFRCHSAFVVSLSRVERVSGNDLFVAGKALPISKHRRKDFMQALSAQWGKSI